MEELKGKEAGRDESFGSAPTGPGPLSFGQKAAGVNFNPGGDPEVTACKEAFAQMIDRLNHLRSLCIGEKARYLSKAITDCESAQMFAVKAITWKH